MQHTCDFIIFNALRKSTISKLKSYPIEIVKEVEAESQMEHNKYVDTEPQIEHVKTIPQIKYDEFVCGKNSRWIEFG